MADLGGMSRMIAQESGCPDSSRPFRQAETEPPTADPPSELSLLEEVLRRTEGMDDAEPLTGDEIEAFREVARRWAGQPLTLQPVIAELVAAALQSQLMHMGRSLEAWQPLILRIAETLFEDPVACERLAAFWRRLCGEEA